MRAVELVGEINEQHHLLAQVPEDLPVGPVRVILLVPDEDEAGPAWVRGIAQEWRDDLGDTRQEIYTLQDGQPVHEAG